MSASLRFLAFAIVGWTAIRAATLGAFPGTEAFTLGRAAAPPRTAAAAGVPAIVPTDFPAIDPVGSDAMQSATAEAMAAAMPAPAPAPTAIPFYYYPVSAPGGAPYIQASLPAPRRGRLTHIAPEPAAAFYAPIPQLDDWPLSRMAAASMPVRRSSATMPQQSQPLAALKSRDRLQLSAWALLRGRPGPASLATGGMLGGSQAGTRLTYSVTPMLAASLRGSTPVGGARGGEIAAGVRITPFRSIPISLTAERRQAIGRTGGGRSAFAMFIEGGLYQRPMPWGFALDAYAQAGVVGARSRDLFADGALTFTRPMFGRYSAGFGIWGGIQPSLSRVDVGPRVSMRIRNNMRVHLDWRQRVAGNAEPGSGPALTLAADF